MENSKLSHLREWKDHGRKKSRLSLALGLWIFCSCFPLFGGESSHRGAFMQSMQQLELPPGHAISLFAAEPDVMNPIALSVDERGRVFLAETDRYRDAVFDVVTQKPEWLPEDLSFRTVHDRTRFLKNVFRDHLEPLTRGSERIRLLEDANGDGLADSSPILADGFSTIPTGPAAGILAYRGQVWFQCLPGLWRLDWDPASGQAFGLRQLHEGFGVHVGVSGHDLHGITWGPEGRLYFSMGDRGLHVETSDGVLDYPDTGTILRCEPDGSNLEVVAYGLRNPQEIVFDPYGNLFAGDNDTSGADQSRVLHILPHGDYGWRCSYQHMTGFGPWVQEGFWKGDLDDVLPSTGYVSQGPSGFALHPEAGTRSDVPGPFFMCDFPGGIRSFDLQASGSTFAPSRNQKWLWNLWATDLAFGPDGSMYVADWVAGWQQPEKGRVYRIQGDAQHVGKLGGDVRPILRTIAEETVPEQIAAWLSHDNQWVRREAQFRLVGLGHVSSRVFVRTLRSDPSVLARLHAVWGLSQLTRLQGISGQSFYLNAAQLGVNDPQSKVRRATLEWLSDVPESELLEEVIDALDDTDPLVVQHAAITLAEWVPHLSDAKAFTEDLLMDGVVAKLEHIPMKGAAHLRHGFHLLLSQWIQHIPFSDGLLNRLNHHDNASVRLAMLQAMRRLGHKDVALFLHDERADIRASAVRAIYDDRIDDALSSLVHWTPEKDAGLGVYRRWLWAHYFLGDSNHLEKLIEWLDPKPVHEDPTRFVMPSEARQECVKVMQHWEHGTDLDPVNGLWRPFKPRSVASLEQLIAPKWSGLFEHASEASLLPIIDWISDQSFHSATPFVEQTARNEETPVGLRGRAIQALFHLLPDQRNTWLRLGLESGADEIRTAVLSEVKQEDGPALLPMLQDWFENERSVPLRQSIVMVVARMDQSDARTLFETWWTSFLEGTFPPELELELLEAVRGSDDPARLGWWHVYRDALKTPSSNPIPMELIFGGDWHQGRLIFRDRAEVACMRCHRSEGEGGVVGPALDGISDRLTPVQILQSILYPNASITPGYASERFLLRDGEDVSGMVLQEEDGIIELRQSDGQVIQLSQQDIEKRLPSLSPMPEGVAAALKPRELRDLMAYLMRR